MLVSGLLDNYFGDDLLHDMFAFPVNSENTVFPVMRTDIIDVGENYQLEIEMPGYDKECVHADLKDGYLTITGEKMEKQDEKDTDGKLLKQERYSGKCKRSYFVGTKLKEDNIHAKFEDGILKIVFPKPEHLPEEENKYIEIL